MVEVQEVHIEPICSSCVTLGNANELLVGVIKELAGNDISNSIEGSSVTQSLIIGIAAPIFQAQIKSQLQ